MCLLNCWEHTGFFPQCLWAGGRSHFITRRIWHSHYSFLLCLKREGFQAIPDTIQSHNQQTRVIVEDDFTAGCVANKVIWPESVPRKQMRNFKLLGAVRVEPKSAQEPTIKQNQEKGWTKVTKKGWKASSSEASHKEWMEKSSPFPLSERKDTMTWWKWY